eukprot:gene8393-9874_t
MPYFSLSNGGSSNNLGAGISLTSSTSNLTGSSGSKENVFGSTLSSSSTSVIGTCISGGSGMGITSLASSVKSGSFCAGSGASTTPNNVPLANQLNLSSMLSFTSSPASSSPSTSSPNAASPTTFLASQNGPISPKAQWTAPSLPPYTLADNLRPLTKSLDAALLHATAAAKTATAASAAADSLAELDGISFNPNMATSNQRLMFLERVKSFLMGLSMRMEPAYDLSSPYRHVPSVHDDLTFSTHVSRPIRFRSIAHLFHHEMVNFGRMRTQWQFDHYKCTIEMFLQIYSSAPWEEDAEYVLHIALDLYNFLHTHRKDPENLLLGMTPSKDIQRRVKKYFYVVDKERGVQKPRKFAGRWELRISRPSLIENISTWATLDDKELLSRTVREFAAQLERERMSEGDIVIVKLPKGWDVSENGISTIIDPNHHEFDEGSFLFARYQREADALGINCFVHLVADEDQSRCVRVPHSRVVSLNMIDIAIDRNKMERLITNPYDAFISELRSAVKDTTKHTLASHGFNVGLIGQGLNFNGVRCVSIEELNHLKTSISALRGNEEFLNEIDQLSGTYTQLFAQYLKCVYMNESKGSFQLYSTKDEHQASEAHDDEERLLVAEYNAMFAQPQSALCPARSTEVVTRPLEPCTRFFSSIRKQYTKFKPYLPMVRSLVGDIEHGKMFCLRAKDSLQGLITECDLAIDTIGTGNVKLLDGSKKKELTNWWLQTISSTVDSYLQEKGFDSDAVPNNYIDEAPASLSKVRENLRIVNLVLKPSTQVDIEERLKELFAPLKKRIYLKIDEFLSLGENLLYDKLKKNKSLFGEGSDLDVGLDKVDLRAVLMILKQISSDVLSNLIEDILYIRDMKYLEEKFYSEEVLSEVAQPVSNERLSLSNIVPITGLVFSRLLRIKHELRTVLEVHDCKVVAKSPFPNLGHHGVIIGKKDEAFNS